MHVYDDQQSNGLVSPLGGRLVVKIERLASLAPVLAVSLFLSYVYINWLSPNYSYLGFSLQANFVPSLCLSFALLLISAIALPTKMLKFSDYFLWMIFYFIYIPSMLFVPLQDAVKSNQLSLMVALATSFFTMVGLSRYTIRVSSIKCSYYLFICVFFSTYALLNLYVLSVYGGNLNLVQFSDVYGQRQLAEDVAGGSLVGYATGILSGAFNPFLMAVGLTERRKLWIGLGIAGQVFMYSTAALKFVLLSCILVPIFYLAHVRKEDISSGRLGLLIVFSCIVPLTIIPLLGDVQEGVGWQIVSIIFMRTYGMAGALTGVYGQFFTGHPYTFYSHINLVGMLFPYPYTQSIGQEIGFDLAGTEVNANANFWATDGIAAAGIFGVLLIGLVIGCFLVFANGLLKVCPRRLGFIAFVPFLIMISNSSFFTSLFTGGGLVLLALVYFWGGVCSRGSSSKLGA